MGKFCRTHVRYRTARELQEYLMTGKSENVKCIVREEVSRRKAILEKGQPVLMATESTCKALT